MLIYYCKYSNIILELEALEKKLSDALAKREQLSEQIDPHKREEAKLGQETSGDDDVMFKRVLTKWMQRQLATRK